jgi:peptidoglycan LD-endopeptidase LytH
MRFGRFAVVPVLAAIGIYTFSDWFPRGGGLALLRHPIVTFRLARASPPTELPVPVAGVSRNRLSDTWHAARTGGRVHEGIDIFAPRGTPVTSTTRGIILTVGQGNLGGNFVRIYGPGGHSHYYAHLDRFADVREGDVVEPGTVIGFVGDSGNARGGAPHLHYGIYTAGGATNPYPFLASR